MNLFLFIYFLIYKQKSFNIGIILIFEKEKKKNTIILNFYNNLNLMLHVHRMMVYIFF